MIANLPMYHRPELEDAHNRFWQLIKKYLKECNIESPKKLSQDAGEMEVWQRSDLVLSQACGMPYRKILHGKVTLIGTPEFGINGCPSGYYRSAFVVHKNDERSCLADYENALFAYNNEMSQSGFSAAKAETKKHKFWFQDTVCSGGHLNSAEMVASKKAEIAAIDAVSLTLMERYDDFYADIKIICWTKPTPALPYITAIDQSKANYFNAIKNAIDALSQEDRKLLMIKDLINISSDIYLSIE